jgi:hypothetical protein
MATKWYETALKRHKIASKHMKHLQNGLETALNKQITSKPKMTLKRPHNVPNMTLKQLKTARKCPETAQNCIEMAQNDSKIALKLVLKSPKWTKTNSNLLKTA